MNVQPEKYTPKPIKIIGKIFEIAFFTLCAVIVIWLSLRAIWQKGPKEFRDYVTTPTAESAEVYRLNDYNSTELGKPIHISNVYKTGNSSLQFTLCFNKYVDESVDPAQFIYALETETGTKYPCYYRYDKKTVMYTHTKLCFENLDFADVDEFDVKIYYKGELYDICTAYKNDGFAEKEWLSKREATINYDYTEEGIK